MENNKIITDLLDSAFKVGRTEADMFCITKKLDIHMSMFYREHLNLSISKNTLTIWANFRTDVWAKPGINEPKQAHIKRFYKAIKHGTIKPMNRNDPEHFDSLPQFRDGKSIMSCDWAEYKLELDLADPDSIEIATNILERLEKHNSYFITARKAAIISIWIIMGLMIAASLLY